MPPGLSSSGDSHADKLLLKVTGHLFSKDEYGETRFHSDCHQTFYRSSYRRPTALYSDPEVCRQVLQMPYQSPDVRRKRLAASDERAVKLIALHDNKVIGNIGLEQCLRIRQRHVGAIGMGVAVAWQGKGVGSMLMTAVLKWRTTG